MEHAPQQLVGVAIKRVQVEAERPGEQHRVLDQNRRTNKKSHTNIEGYSRICSNSNSLFLGKHTSTAGGLAATCINRGLKGRFSQPLEENCISEEVRIGCRIIFHLSKLWKAKSFILCDVIFLERLQGKFGIDHSWELLKSNNSYNPGQNC